MNEHVTAAWADLQKIRKHAPLVLNVTNYVAANTVANALLALGASPVMSHQIGEMEDLAAISGAVACNMGTPVDALPEAMCLAGEAAVSKNIPVVFDPVGAGASAFRNELAATFLKRVRPTVIRGNGSEITAVAGKDGKTKGVDSSLDSNASMDTARNLAGARECVVCASGPKDVVTDSKTVLLVKNGHPLMPRITGLGCVATAVCAAFAAVNPSPLDAVVHGMAVMGIAGEMAAEECPGPGAFLPRFLDALFLMNKNEIAKRLRVKRTA